LSCLLIKICFVAAGENYFDKFRLRKKQQDKVACSDTSIYQKTFTSPNILSTCKIPWIGSETSPIPIKSRTKLATLKVGTMLYRRILE
jgi:hypothetical protein